MIMNSVSFGANGKQIMEFYRYVNYIGRDIQYGISALEILENTEFSGMGAGLGPTSNAGLEITCLRAMWDHMTEEDWAQSNMRRLKNIEALRADNLLFPLFFSSKDPVDRWIAVKMLAEFPDLVVHLKPYLINIIEKDSYFRIQKSMTKGLIDGMPPPPGSGSYVFDSPIRKAAANLLGSQKDFTNDHETQKQIILWLYDLYEKSSDLREGLITGISYMKYNKGLLGELVTFVKNNPSEDEFFNFIRHLVREFYLVVLIIV